MKAITIRGIEDELYEIIKEKSKRKGMSLNKYVLESLKEATGVSKKVEYDDLDEFIGSWSEENYKELRDSAKLFSSIDGDLWK